MCWRLRPYVFEAAATAVPSGAEPLPSGDIYIKRSAEMARKPAIGRAGRSTGDPYHIYTLAVAREMERQYLRRVHERPAPVTWSGSSPLAWCHTCV